MQLTLSNATIKLYGGGIRLRDFIHIDDLIELLLMVGMWQSHLGGKVFNVSGGEAVSLREAAEVIIAAVGKGKIEQTPWPADARQVEIGDFIADITKIKQVTGWQPRTEFKVGVQNSLG